MPARIDLEKVQLAQKGGKTVDCMIINNTVAYGKYEQDIKLFKPQQQLSNVPLTFTAVKNSEVFINCKGNPEVGGLQYRRGLSGTWHKYNIMDFIDISEGLSVQFRNTNQTLSTSQETYIYFIINGQVSASGDIQSLLNYTLLKLYCYYRLFYNCSGLLSSPLLTSEILKDNCYKLMFYNCTALKYVKAAFTHWDNATSLWLYNTSGEYYFYKLGLDTSIRDYSHIPTGWSIQTY